MDQDRDSLKTYLKIFGWLLLVCSCLPFDFYSDQPVWPWLGVVDGKWADILALALPLICAITFIILSRSRLSKTTLAFAILAGLAFAWLADRWSLQMPYSLNVYENLPSGLPNLFSRALWLVLLGIILLAAGVRLGSKEYNEQIEGQPRPIGSFKTARLLTISGIGLIFLFYWLPHKGSIPLFRLFIQLFKFGIISNV